MSPVQDKTEPNPDTRQDTSEDSEDKDTKEDGEKKKPKEDMKEKKTKEDSEDKKTKEDNEDKKTKEDSDDKKRKEDSEDKKTKEDRQDKNNRRTTDISTQDSAPPTSSGTSAIAAGLTTVSSKSPGDIPTGGPMDRTQDTDWTQSSNDVSSEGTQGKLLQENSVMRQKLLPENSVMRQKETSELQK